MRNNRGFNPRKRESSGRPRRAISASNAVVNAVFSAAAIYRVPAYRMQSRCFTVTGAAGEPRPLFIGVWEDGDGAPHYGGLADVLLTPTVYLAGPIRPHRVQIAVWCECKSGTGRLTKDQQAFKEHILATGGHWLECRDSAQALLDFFREYGVEAA